MYKMYKKKIGPIKSQPTAILWPQKFRYLNHRCAAKFMLNCLMLCCEVGVTPMKHDKHVMFKKMF